MAVSETSIYQVEPGDDLSTVLETIAQSQERRLIFVVDGECATFTSAANLRYISDYAADLNREFVLVTSDVRLRSLAEGLCIPVYAEVEEACAVVVAEEPEGERRTLVFRFPWARKRKGLAARGTLGAGRESKSEQGSASDHLDIARTQPVPALKKEVSAIGEAGIGLRDGGQAGMPSGRAVSLRPPGRTRRRWRPRPGFIFILFLLILTGGAFLYLNTQRTVIILTPARRASQGELRVLATTRVEAAGPVRQQGALGWQLPAIPIEGEVVVRGNVPTTGKKVVGWTPARGRVLFFNHSERALRVPAGTVVVADNGLRFRTLTEVVVPRQKTEYLLQVAVGSRAGQATAAVEALEKGSSGNVKVGRIRKIEGNLGSLRVINTSPLSGGEDKALAVVAAQDAQTLAAKLREKAWGEAADLLKGKMEGGRILLPETITLAHQAFQTEGAVGEERAVLTGSLRVRVQALTVAAADLTQAARHALLAQLEGKWQPLGKPQWQLVRVEPGAKKEGAVLVMTFSGQVVGAPDPRALARALAGRSRKEAEAKLRGLAEVADFTFTRGGAVLPRWERLITILIKNDYLRLPT